MVDLRKIYDRVEWTFLREVLNDRGFNQHISNRIMSCIYSMPLTMLSNDKRLAKF